MPRLKKRLFLLASALKLHAVVARGYSAANNSLQYCLYVPLSAQADTLHVLTTG